MAYPDTIKTDQDVLDAFIAVAPYLDHVVRQEVVVCVTNTEKNLITVLNDKVKFSPPATRSASSIRDAIMWGWSTRNFTAAASAA